MASCSRRADSRRFLYAAQGRLAFRAVDHPRRPSGAAALHSRGCGLVCCPAARSRLLPASRCAVALWRRCGAWPSWPQALCVGPPGPRPQNAPTILEFASSAVRPSGPLNPRGTASRNSFPVASGLLGPSPPRPRPSGPRLARDPGGGALPVPAFWACALSWRGHENCFLARVRPPWASEPPWLQALWAPSGARPWRGRAAGPGP